MTESAHAYGQSKYNSRTRWMNFWHQIDEVARLGGKRVLEIGKGSGIVSDRLRAMGYEVVTVDIDQNLKPDIVASAERLPFADRSFDVVLAAEVLEHIPFERVSVALSEIRRVASYAVITLPHAGSAMIGRLRVPWLGDVELFIKIPFFWVRHYNKYGNEVGHYWELGKRGFARWRFRALLKEAGFVLQKEKLYADDFIRIFFVVR